jgi:SAM-dependent methyltransferase
LPTFTAHNIVLPDGEQTCPTEPVIETLARARAMLRTMALVFADRDPASVRIADIGCLEGGFSVVLARAGYDTVGIEGRPANVECCEYVRAKEGRDNLRFVLDDARNIVAHGPFDAAYCAGLLYHLDEPSAFLADLGRVTTRLLMLETHFATEVAPDGVPLGPWTEHEGRRGRWYPEVAEDVDAETGLIPRWASIGNPSSFWLDKRELVRVLRDSSFTSVYEQYDFTDEDDYIERMARSLFVGVCGE